MTFLEDLGHRIVLIGKNISRFGKHVGKFKDKSSEYIEEQQSKSKPRNYILVGILSGIYAVIFFIIIHFCVIRVVVPTGSMIPTIPIESDVFATNIFFYSHIKTGDIVIFRPNQQFKEKYFIKRVIGTPGDLVVIRDGYVWVNGKKLDDSYVEYRGDYNGTFVVPQGEYFMLGDNRANSDDSRYWNNPFVKASQIKYMANFEIKPDFKFKILC